jgi:hypothetical protein
MTTLRRENFKNLAEYVQIQQSQANKMEETLEVEEGAMQLEQPGDAGEMQLESQISAGMLYQQANAEDIEILKECLNIFSQVLQPKTNERTLIYGKLNEHMVE